MKQTTITHTFEPIKKPNPNIITPNKPATTVSQKTPAPSTPPSIAPAINAKDLMAQIQSIKAEILTQCKSYMDDELKKMTEKQQEQNKRLEDLIQKNTEEQATTLKMIQELTVLITGIHGTPIITQPSSNKDQTKNLNAPPDEMDIDKDNHKRKEPLTPRPSHRKTRATTNAHIE